MARVSAAGDRTDGFSHFKVDSICLRMFPHCGFFNIGPLPYAKFSGTNQEIGTCVGTFQSTDSL